MASADIESPIADPKLLSVQLCRGVAAWLVALYHVATIADSRWVPASGPNWLYPFEAFGFAGVDLFFVISGIVMTVTCYRRLGDAREAGPFLLRRAARIYPLYWVVTAAVLAVCWLAPQFATPEKTNPLRIAKSLALWPQAGFPVVTVGWTLTYEVCFYLAFAALVALPRRAFTPALGLWLVAILATYFWYEPPPTPAAAAAVTPQPFISPLALEFIAGCLIGLACCNARLPLAGVALALGLAIFVGLGLRLHEADLSETTNVWRRVAVFGVGSALLLYGALAWELAASPVLPRSLIFWGDASYSLYLTHGYVIQAFTQFTADWPPAHEGQTKAALALACLAACGAVAAICHWMIERPLNAWARRLLQR
jgi:peptidoglycan/LPS O-acetylase OafA/YrhL